MRSIAILALALAIAAPLAVAQDKHPAKPKAQKLTGWVGDEKCGAKGADASHADCAKKCVEGGAAIVFISGKDKTVLKVDNQDALKGQLGQYVRVTGPVTDGTLHVDKVDMLKQPKAKPQKDEHKTG